MTDPDEIRAKREEIEEAGPCRQGDDGAKETLSVVTRHATREELLCSLENCITKFAHAKDQLVPGRNLLPELGSV
jgi:hypothetical protein